MSTNAKKTNPINTEKKKAPKYKVTNWSEYNQSLITLRYPVELKNLTFL